MQLTDAFLKSVSCTKMLLLIAFVCCFIYASGQTKSNVVGFQFKPVFSSKFFGTGPQILSDSGFTHTINQRLAYAGGIVIRKAYTKTLALEFGINYTRRSYRINSEFSGKSSNTDFKIIGYELPVSQLVFVRLSEHIYMNVSAGVCVNMFPSDVIKQGEDILLYAGRRYIFNPSLIANLGFEYRTTKSGYFYIGSSLNRPFTPIYSLAIDYVRNSNVLSTLNTQLNGTYLTVDFRYFFHENPDKKARRKSQNNN